jgi:hypothetical protein
VMVILAVAAWRIRRKQPSSPTVEQEAAPAHIVSG